MIRSLFAELRRRNVIRGALLYVGAVWALAQGIASIGPAFDMPGWGTRWFVVAGVIGFPFWIAFTWFFELTPEGLKLERDVVQGASITRHTGRKLDLWIISLMAIAIVLLLTDRFVGHRGLNATAEAAVSDKSIAVLPFVNLSSDKEQEYFSDGISEDLLNLLTKVQTLRVAARTSSFSFKGKGVAIPEIANALRVANVLSGSVRKSGNSVRITAQLVHAADGYQIWSQTWDRTLDDIFKVQDEIAGAVVSQLRVKLLGEVPTARPVDTKAYPLILQAEALADQGTAEGRTQANARYQQALALAPNEARAWAGLARNYYNQMLTGSLAAAEGERLAKEAANKALEIDPGDVIALSILGALASDFESDLSAAARYLQHALELEPSNLVALSSAAILLMNIGRLDEAQMLFEYRVAHDPANPIAYNNLASCLYYARQWQAVIDTYRKALGLSPGFSGAHYTIGLALLLGRLDAAGALKEFEAEPDELTRMQGVPLALHALGRKQEADAALRTLLEKGQEQPEVIALAYAYRGEPDAAFEWLDKAILVHDPFLPTALKEPLLETLHNDPRWLPFLRKIGFAPEQLARIEFKVKLPDSGGTAR